MLLNATKIVDLSDGGVVHVAWERARMTMCGVPKINWPYPRDWSAPVGCEHCRNAYIMAAIDEANSDMGFTIIEQAS